MCREAFARDPPSLCLPEYHKPVRTLIPKRLGVCPDTKKHDTVNRLGSLTSGIKQTLETIEEKSRRWKIVRQLRTDHKRVG